MCKPRGLWTCWCVTERVGEREIERDIERGGQRERETDGGRQSEGERVREKRVSVDRS